MNTSDVKTVKMFGPSISDPTRIVNRDVPACDEQAYKAAGYKRGSIEEVSEPQPESKPPVFTTEEVSLEEDTEPQPEQPAKRRKKVQN